MISSILYQGWEATVFKTRDLQRSASSEIGTQDKYWDHIGTSNKQNGAYF